MPLVMANTAPRCIVTVIVSMVLDPAMVRIPKQDLVTMIVAHAMALVIETSATVIVAPSQVRVKVFPDVVRAIHNIHRWLIAVVLAALSVQSFGMAITVVMAHSIIAVDRC